MIATFGTAQAGKPTWNFLLPHELAYGFIPSVLATLGLAVLIPRRGLSWASLAAVLMAGETGTACVPLQRVGGVELDRWTPIRAAAKDVVIQTDGRRDRRTGIALQIEYAGGKRETVLPLTPARYRFQYFALPRSAQRIARLKVDTLAPANRADRDPMSVSLYRTP